MTVKQLKERLQNIIDDLDGYDDDKEIKMVSNTYFLGDCRTFIGISGYDGGYINPNNLVEDDDNEEEDW